jgi:hypothetical protein
VLEASTPISFRDFSLEFENSGGVLDMGSNEPRIVSGAFTLKGGSLQTSVIRGDSLTTFTCKNVKSQAGTVTLKGTICIDAATFVGDLVVEASATFYNKSNIDAIVIANGNFTNNGLTRRGPGYAAYGEGNLALCIRGNFRQNGTYTVQNTHFTGDVEQTIGTEAGKVIEGLYYDDNPGSHLRATTDLVFTGAKFVVSPDTIRKGYFAMDTFRLYHSSGNFQVDSGTLQADYITGGEDGNAVFTIRTIDTKSGRVSISKHFSTSSCAIHDTLVIEENGIVYNQGYVIPVIATRGTNIKGKIGSGPGYASYDDGYVILDGLKLEQWR